MTIFFDYKTSVHSEEQQTWERTLKIDGAWAATADATSTAWQKTRRKMDWTDLYTFTQQQR